MTDAPYISPTAHVPRPERNSALIGTVVGFIFMTALFMGMAVFIWQDSDGWRQAVTDLLAQARGTPWALPLICVAYVVSGLVMFPITLLNIIVAVVFGLWGIVYGLIGVMVNAVLFFWIGHMVRNTRRGRELLAQPKIKPIDRKLHQSGMAGMVAIHALPVPPYTVLNFIAGLSSVTAITYLVGTFLAMLPGATARGVVGESLTQILMNPTSESFYYLLGGLALWVVMVAGMHMALKRFSRKEKTAS